MQIYEPLGLCGHRGFQIDFKGSPERSGNMYRVGFDPSQADLERTVYKAVRVNAVLL